ncbi:6PF2K-domain-containing protein [Suhomyces tanzawaensis NRRL Y-17324]|uniref:6PF2K-domain-containing protein n=1 Tax=Suhomyces tanzawaensis NRRL Y-17324 TaxID=984487 RepID=A0A1E4SBP3_9ASCO|nr:6PF2K-domain-containing protein [Suhomyces tanzawaensis NRRL Y-17324]ODV76898.1 6PF2K-domain-containing protein [Suhomyces tanzawaensis NRRL Y-17324]
MSDLPDTSTPRSDHDSHVGKPSGTSSPQKPPSGPASALKLPTIETPGDFAPVHRKGRKKSNSISNAVLQHARANNKKVSFSNYQSYNSSQIFTSSNSSSNLDASSHNSSEEDLTTLNGQDLTAPRAARFTTSVTPSPSITPQISNSGNSAHTSSHHSSKRNSLRKLQSYPFSSERMGVSQSLDSQLLENHLSEGSTTPLPEFNKRPLTDTPIVSSMASPVTREQSSDEEDEEDGDDHTIKSKKPEPAGKESKIGPISKTRNISHLSLADLSMEEEKPHRAKSESISPMTTNVNPSPSESSTSILIPAPNATAAEDAKKLQMDHQTKTTVLQDVPIELQQQFEKTPSIERLKNLLLTKPPPSARKAYTLNIPGQTSSKTSPDGKIASVDVGSKLVIVMVGLPARGKSYITNKLTRYLNWLQHDCRVFNVGNTRRKDKENNVGPENQPLPDTNTPNNEQSTPSPELNTTKSPAQEGKANQVKSPSQHNADFFSPDNKTSNALREKWAMDTLDQLLDYVINGPGSVGIFDATNSTKQRRVKVLKRIQQRSKGELKVLFLESICSDPTIIESNIRLKLSGPDYRDMDPELALKDFVGRLHNYEKAYETIDEAEESIPGYQYVKMIDVGKKVVSYNVQGFLASQTIYFLLNFNLCERQIWITRHGESVDNLSGRIGGDSRLTKRGQLFAKTLAKFMNFQRQEFRKQQLERFSTRLELKYNSIFNDDDIANIDNIPTEPNFCVWTSMLYRAVETGRYFDEQLYSIKEMRMLNELGGGKFEGLTYDEIQRKYPREFESRLRNKLSYRYPGVGGESYLDVLTRLRPLITEIERTTDHVLIVSHRVVLRILLAYFLNLDKSSIGELDVPLHTLYCLESKPYGTDYRMYEYDEGLDWFVKVEPDHQKNMKEVGVVFKERKYSVVPTAPPSSNSRRQARHSIAPTTKPASRKDHHGNSEAPQNSLSSKKLEDLKKMRSP